MPEPFCQLPFKHVCLFSPGQLRPCCIAPVISNVKGGRPLTELVNAPEMMALRAEMLEGAEPTPCAGCYRSANSSGYSHRLHENLKLKRLADPTMELDWQTNDLAVQPNEILSLELRLDNTCPNICLMCGPSDSSSWQSILKKRSAGSLLRFDPNHGSEASRQHRSILLDVVRSPLKHFPNLRHLRIAGGEPLASKLHKPLIDALISSGRAGEITLEYITSCSIPADDYAERWRHFSEIFFQLSCDGPSGINDYIRYPSTISDVENFLNQLAKISQNVRVHAIFEFTLQALNAPHLASFLRYTMKQQCKYADSFASPVTTGVHLLRSPKELSISALPANVISSIVGDLEAIPEHIASSALSPGRRSITDILSFIREYEGIESTVSCFKYLNQLDEVRRIDRKDYLQVDDFFYAAHWKAPE